MGSALPHDFFAQRDPQREERLLEVATFNPVYINEPDALLMSLDISYSNVVRIDLQRMPRLRRFNAMYCPRIELQNDSLPVQIELVDLRNSGIRLVSIENLQFLLKFAADGCVLLQLTSKHIPRQLEELSISDSAVGAIDLRECQKLRILRASRCSKVRISSDYIPNSVQELQLDDTMIEYADLREMQRLEILNLSDNFNFVLMDSCIPRGVLALKCAGDSIGRLGLREMRNLEILDFSGNIDIEYDVLPPSLRMLTLSNTSIKHLDLRLMKQLQYLDISGVTRLAIEDFHLPKSLISLIASDCQELALDKTNLLHLKNLTNLDISNTYFRATNTAEFPKNLKCITARRNSIKFIDLQGCELERLDIYDNVGCEISNIPECIKYYNVGGKSSTEMALSLFPRLEELHMQNNKEIRLINATMPATLKLLDIRGTSIRNIDFSEVAGMQTFLYDDELYTFKDGRLPQGLKEYQTTRISDLNISGVKSLEVLDLSDNEAMASRYNGIYYKIPPTLRVLRICGISLRFLDLTEADSLERIAHRGNECIQLRDGVIPPLLCAFRTKFIDFLDFSRAEGLRCVDLSNNAGMMRHYAVLNAEHPAHYLEVPSSVIQFVADGETVQYLDLCGADCLRNLSCRGLSKMWFKDGFVPANLVELRSSQVEYVDFSSSLFLEILDISNNNYISIRNGYLPPSLRQLLFAFDRETDSLYSLTLKLQHLKELYFIDCTDNPNVNFDGDFVPSGVEVVKIQGCKLITTLNLVQAKAVRSVKMSQNVRLIDVPASLEILQAGEHTIDVPDCLRLFLQYQAQTQIIHQMHTRIRNYELKQQDLLNRQKSRSPKRGQAATDRASE